MRFPGFDGEWEYSKIEDFFEFKNGLNKEKEFFGKGTPIINFTDVYKLSSIRKKDVLGLVELNDSEKERFSAKIGDVFFTRTSETINDIGMTATLVEEINDCAFSGFVLRARPKGESFYPEFTSYLFSVNSVRKEIVTKSSMTTRALTSGTLLNKVKFIFPNNINEQKKITAFLSAIDNRILTQNKIIEDYQLLKKGTMQKLFKQELRFKDNEGNTFSDWDLKKLGNVTNINMGQSPESSSYNSDGDGSYLIQGNADIFNRKTSPRNWTSKPTKLCDIGDLILTVRAPVGTVAKSNHKACIGRGVCSIKSKTISNIEFIYQFLLDYENRWTRLEQGSTFTAVSGRDIKSIEINLPSIKEQQKIAATLSVIDAKITLETKLLEQYKSQKKYLLQNLFI